MALPKPRKPHPLRNRQSQNPSLRPKNRLKKSKPHPQKPSLVFKRDPRPLRARSHLLKRKNTRVKKRSMAAPVHHPWSGGSPKSTVLTSDRWPEKGRAWAAGLPSAIFSATSSRAAQRPSGRPRQRLRRNRPLRRQNERR